MIKLTVSAVVSTLLASVVVSGAAAQDKTALVENYPATTAPSPGIPGNEAVNPAPDAQGQPYLGAGRQNFYDPMDRERALEQRLQAAASSGALNARQVQQVRLALSKVVAEDHTQIARHGSLRDWDREKLNDMMNHIVADYAQLRG